MIILFGHDFVLFDLSFVFSFAYVCCHTKLFHVCIALMEIPVLFFLVSSATPFARIQLRVPSIFFLLRLVPFHVVPRLYRTYRDPCSLFALSFALFIAGIELHVMLLCLFLRFYCMNRITCRFSFFFMPYCMVPMSVFSLISPPQYRASQRRLPFFFRPKSRKTKKKRSVSRLYLQCLAHIIMY